MNLSKKSLLGKYFNKENFSKDKAVSKTIQDINRNTTL